MGIRGQQNIRSPAFTDGFPPKLWLGHLFGSWQPLHGSDINSVVRFGGHEAYLIKQGARYREALDGSRKTLSSSLNLSLSVSTCPSPGGTAGAVRSARGT